MSGGLFLRAVVVQLVAVAALSAVLGLALPHGFFEDWGWLVGPAAWLTCAALTALMLRLPQRTGGSGQIRRQRCIRHDICAHAL